MKKFLDVGILLHPLLLHQDLFLVLHLAVLRDGGVAVDLQLVVTVLRLAWLVVGVLVGVEVRQGLLAELLLMGGGGGELQLAEEKRGPQLRMLVYHFQFSVRNREDVLSTGPCKQPAGVENESMTGFHFNLASISSPPVGQTVLQPEQL